MTWKPELDELEKRKEMAAEMGGPDSVAFHHSRGKLTVRERIDKLGDEGSFEEIGDLAGSGLYDNGKLESFTPANTVVGTISLDGRRAMLNGGDFTVRGGAADAAVGNKGFFAEKMALEWRMPYIRLLDAVGGSVRTFEKIGRTYIPDNPGTLLATQLLQVVPVVSAVMGSVAGLPAVWACMAHFTLMVKKTSQVFVAGPPVVKAAFGQDITKEELGSERIQAYESGIVNNVAEDEEDAFRIIKRFLSYLPASVWEMPPRTEPTDDPERGDEELLSIIPREDRKTYNAHEILERVMDKDSILEISPHYGKSRITAFARVNGYPVGAMINNPRFLGGSMDVAAGAKVGRFIELCDLFHLPMVYLADEPGFLVGLKSEKQGIVRAGAGIVSTVVSSRMPWITVIIRQLYGVAGGLHLRPAGMFQRCAWPSSN
ncbi:MAG: hypothetical protein JRD68_09255, partial [Deltaproteobacteria bacterium]|nr:hypothetical protein [Deltaproteobacteria bacterium]